MQLKSNERKHENKSVIDKLKDIPINKTMEEIREGVMKWSSKYNVSVQIH